MILTEKGEGQILSIILSIENNTDNNLSSENVSKSFGSYLGETHQYNYFFYNYF